MGVRNPDPKDNALITKITFSHSLEPPRWQKSHLKTKVVDDRKSIGHHHTRKHRKKQVLFEKNKQKKEGKLLRHTF
jgi:hypothetical protein